MIDEKKVEQHIRCYAYYRHFVEKEAVERVNKLVEERDDFVTKHTPSLDDLKDMSDIALFDEYNDINAQIEVIEKGIKDRYRDSFRTNPREILTAIKVELPEFDKKTFKGLLKARKKAHENLLKEYSKRGKDELPLFVKQLERASEENYENFYDFIADSLRTELEVAEYYRCKRKAEGLIENYVAKFYTPKVPAYDTLMNAPVTNALAQLPYARMDKDEDTGDLHALIRVGKSATVFTIDAEGSSLPPAQAEKVFDAFLRKLSNIVPYQASPEEILKAREVDFSVKEYMELFRVSDKKNAREQLTKSVRWIYYVSAEWEEERYYDKNTGERLKKPAIGHFHSRIFDTIGDIDHPVKKGICEIKFNPDIVTSVSYGYPMQLPNALFSTNSQTNPYSYSIGKRLAIHKNMNVMKPNENRISVKSLLESIQGIPTYEEVKQGSRHITRKIIDPFERDLFALVDYYGVLSDVHYCNKGGEPLTEEQLESYTYDEWITWLVEFTFTDYPEQEDRRKLIEEIRAEKKKNKVKNKAKQKAKRG